MPMPRTIAPSVQRNNLLNQRISLLSSKDGMDEFILFQGFFLTTQNLSPGID
jgi:hypothetical protein